MKNVGIVIIGRNEGKRLLSSLESVVGFGCPIVYVDSGSTDGSCESACKYGVEVVNLDLSIPFTAARARNTGFFRLSEQHPEVEYVQFLDGDCEVVSGWLQMAKETLDTHSEVVAVCGWRQERYPEKSLFNRICDVEWHLGDIGKTQCFGGDVMIRTQAFQNVNGYNETVIAAEDDELSVRLRQANGLLLRIDHTCTIHDADMHSLMQWWQRAKRCGFAYANVSSLHGASPERKFVKEVRRTWLWGILIPLISLILALPTHGLSFVTFTRYPLTMLRTFYATRRRGFALLDSFAWAMSCSVSDFPSAAGLIKYYLDNLMNKQYKIIEYKGT